jgi:hypothetical protein
MEPAFQRVVTPWNPGFMTPDQGAHPRRNADPAACAATADWLRTSDSEKSPEKGPKIEI